MAWDPAQLITRHFGTNRQRRRVIIRGRIIYMRLVFAGSSVKPGERNIDLVAAYMLPRAGTGNDERKAHTASDPETATVSDGLSFPITFACAH